MFAIHKKQSNPQRSQSAAGLVDLLGDEPSHKAQHRFCTIWTEFGLARSAETKLVKPSALAVMRMQCAKARGLRGRGV
jgi:hypothetical protein